MVHQFLLNLYFIDSLNICLNEMEHAILVNLISLYSMLMFNIPCYVVY